MIPPILIVSITIFVGVPELRRFILINKVFLSSLMVFLQWNIRTFLHDVIIRETSRAISGFLLLICIAFTLCVPLLFSHSNTLDS